MLDCTELDFRILRMIYVSSDCGRMQRTVCVFLLTIFKDLMISTQLIRFIVHNRTIGGDKSRADEINGLQDGMFSYVTSLERYLQFRWDTGNMSPFITELMRNV